MSTVPLPSGAAPDVPGFQPTHVVPNEGLSTWATPDAAVPSEPLDPLLPVRLLDRRGDWGQVLCSNGWSAWVDARLLVTLPQRPPGTGGALVRTADARELLAGVEETLGRYRRAVEDLTAGRTDGETFRLTTRGLRIGVVVAGEEIWLYDVAHDRWCYSDGATMTTVAGGEPSPDRNASGGPAWASDASAGSTRLDTGGPAAGSGPTGPGATRLNGGGAGPAADGGDSGATRLDGGGPAPSGPGGGGGRSRPSDGGDR
ncbi:hypothetical protein [Streptomyces abikoensis]|uniref:hypothetical protein n=1 Tax=Streptomyces abikoensis TaxID=97398 RepID=UPI0016720D72|nr:hypothetical protein [Streptomyces abikoensis]GGP45614.1 hypothetical protein GCM10010214_18240 [Streptomyces abikoensis]